MKKVIILKKIQVAMKAFAPPFFNHFSLSLNRKKHVVMRALRKTKHIHASALDLLHNRIGNLDLIGANVGIAKMKQEKYIVGATLTASVKIPEREGNISSTSSLYG